jgi:hypothetical protein
MLVMFPQGNNYITNEYMDSVHRVHKVGISFLALYMDRTLTRSYTIKQRS